MRRGVDSVAATSGRERPGGVRSAVLRGKERGVRVVFDAERHDAAGRHHASRARTTRARDGPSRTEGAPLRFVGRAARPAADERHRRESQEDAPMVGRALQRRLHPHDGEGDRPQILAESTFIEESLGCEAGAMILDLACGTGRHACELASRGYQVVGYDLSLSMLARASTKRRSAARRSISCRATCAR